VQLKVARAESSLKIADEKKKYIHIYIYLSIYLYIYIYLYIIIVAVLIGGGAAKSCARRVVAQDRRREAQPDGRAARGAHGPFK